MTLQHSDAIDIIKSLWEKEDLKKNHGDINNKEIRDAYLFHALSWQDTCPNYSFAIAKAYGLTPPDKKSIGHCNLRTRILYSIISQNATESLKNKHGYITDWGISEEWKKLSNILQFFNDGEDTAKVKSKLLQASVLSDNCKVWDVSWIPYAHNKPVKEPLPPFVTLKLIVQVMNYWVENGVNDA